MVVRLKLVKFMWEGWELNMSGIYIYIYIYNVIYIYIYIRLYCIVKRVLDG